MENIYEYIKSQETYYQTTPIPVVEGYEWNMFEHIKRTTLYLNSQYQNGKAGENPFNNIILPKINLEHRAVEFALREIEFYIDNSEKSYKSFLLRKFHDKFAKTSGISQFLDQLTECYTDYGGVLVKRLKDGVEVVPLQRLAFVDQSDMMAGPICEKHQMSIDQILDMDKVGWGAKENGATISLEELVALATDEKTVDQSGKSTKTVSKNIEVYEIHGALPNFYLNGEPTKYSRQFHAVAYYKDPNGKEHGVTLFAKTEAEQRYKAFKRDPIYGRALGRGGVEELFEPQVWVNYNEILKRGMLDQASKILYQTADKGFTERNNTKNPKQGEVFTHNPGEPATQLNTNPVNVQLFDNSIVSWNNTAKEIAAAYDSISGAGDNTSVPFRSSMLFNQEAHSLHKYRKGQIGGIFLPEIYRDWIIPMIRKEIVKGDEFLSELTLSEMDEISDQVITATFNKSIIKKLLSDKPSIIQVGEQEALLETYKENFYKQGTKRFLKVLEGEMKDLPIDVTVNITDEEKNWALRAEKLSAVFTQATNILIQNPNFFSEHPEMAKTFNDILESSGLSPIAYSVTKKSVQQTEPQPAQAMQAIKPIGTNLQLKA